MDILRGLLYINGEDVWEAYGAFLSEDNKSDAANYSALLKPASMKSYKAVDFRELDGEKLPIQLLPRFEARDVTLQFTIIGNSRTDFIEKYQAFVGMLRSGWLEVHIPELGKTYRMYYQSCSEYKQLTALEDDAVAGKFKVKLREPQPTV